jgi:streptogramin lyase
MAWSHWRMLLLSLITRSGHADIFGQMFFSQVTGNTISLFDYNAHTFKNFHPPTPASGPLGMRTASDGALWFTEFIARQIGRLNYTSGEITEYPLPLSLDGPSVLRVEVDPYLYFTAQEGNGIGRIEISTGDVKVYTYPSPLSLPTEDTQDSRGNVWFSTISQNTLQYLTPSTGKFTTIFLPGAVLPTSVALVPFVNIAINYGPGNAIWFGELTTNKVGRYQLS